MFERIPNLPVTEAPASPDYVVERDVGLRVNGKPEAEVQYWFRFTVVGKGQFPFDMLRHDMAYPADTMSALRITPSDTRAGRMTPREVTLVHTDRHSFWTPTFGRWASCGWVVKSDA
jgi:hypothetical protein